MLGLGTGLILVSKDGVPGGIRTHDPLLKSYTTAVFSTNFEARLFFMLIPVLASKPPFSNHIYNTISAKLVPTNTTHHASFEFA